MNSKMSHFAALILQVDMLTEVLHFQEFNKISAQKKEIGAFRPATSTNFKAVLAVTVTWAGDTIFAKKHREV